MTSEEHQEVTRLRRLFGLLVGMAWGQQFRSLAGCFAPRKLRLAAPRQQFCSPVLSFGNTRGDRPSLTDKPAILSTRNARRRSLANNPESSGPIPGPFFWRAGF